MTLVDFLSGAVTFGFMTASLFFLRFWKRTYDPLFLSFALAFALLGIGQTVQALGKLPTEESSHLYLIRLLAFSIIIVAIVRKNRSSI